ncbi:MAG: 3-oxoacid CoA-transferase subunit A [Acidimicrobiaceae bacterium]|nr:3-oxoacid CoA-transferase subunit A [Acidimicrobiaceae bacterium]
MSKTRIYATSTEALADINDGATIMCGGFGGAGYPHNLISGLADRKVKGLTVVANNAGHEALFAYGGVRKVVCSYPLGPTSKGFLEVLDRGEAELELEPQGTLVERIRTAGAGLGGFLTQVGLGTELVAGKPLIDLDGKQYAVCKPIMADFALIKAWKADQAGNLIYRHAARNFNSVMAMAAPIVIVEVSEIIDGYLDPDSIHTSGAFVDRLVEVGK